MDVLITGGAGFLGSHLAERLADQDIDIILADDFSRGCQDNLENVRDRENVRVEERDFRSRKDAFEAVKGVDKVYHLAAKIGGVGYLRDKPADIIR